MFPVILASCALIEQKYAPFSDLCLRWRNPIPCAGNRNEPVLRWIKSWIKSIILKRTQIRRIFIDLSICVHPCNPCSDAASLFAEAPQIRNVIYHRFAQIINLRSSAFICGSFFAGAPDSKYFDRINRMDRVNSSTNPVNPVYPVQYGSSFSVSPDINCSLFIKVGLPQNSSPQSHHIPPSRASDRNEPVRRLTAFTENTPKMQE